MSEIPENKESGSSGEQGVGSLDVIVPTRDNVFHDNNVPDAVRGLAQTNARSFGGEVPARLISATMSQMRDDLQVARSENRNLRRTLDDVRDDLAKCRTNEAVLRERVATVYRAKHLRNFAIAGGTVILGVSFELRDYEPGILPALMAVLGFAFILMGWFWPMSRSEE